MVTQIRQGDVLLVRVKKPGANYAPTGEAGLRVEGERTGHAHVLDAEVLSDGKRRVLHLVEPRLLTHEEHRHIEVPPGYWQPLIQREFVPQARPGRRWD